MEILQKPEGFKEQKLYIIPEYRLKDLASSELTKCLYVSDIGIFPQAKYHYRERLDGCDAHIFIYCTDGEGWIELQGQKPFRLASQQLAVIPAGAAHRYGASTHRPWSIHWFHLQGEHASPLIELYELDKGPLPLSQATSSKFLEEFEACYTLLANKTYSMQTHVHVSHLIRGLLSTIGIGTDGSHADKKKESYLETAIRYMNDHLEGSIQLPELAKETGVSKQHMIYLFKKETGCPPIEYFLRLKMQKAGQLLDLTDLTIKEVAGSIGISDPYYFSRLFKKMMGSSPTEYRNIPKG